MNQEAPLRPSLAHFPVSLFSMIMGLTGITLAWREAGPHVPGAAAVASVLAPLAAGLFVLLLAVYLVKGVRHRAAVVAEFSHPIKLHFFPAASISLVLLSAVLMPYSIGLARGLWIVGSIAHLLLTLAVLHQWFNRSHFQMAHLNPAWFIPMVGNIVVPIPGAALGYIEASWLFFSIGIVFWPVLFAIVMNRVLFHDPIIDRLLPTLFILIAPPAIGFVAHLRLSGELDDFGRVLYSFALFMTLFLLTQLPRLSRLSFSIAWWAYSFPLAAMTIATWRIGAVTGNPGYVWLGMGLLALVSVVVAGLVIGTARAALDGRICLPD